jgi:hypothetical protein
LTALKAPSSVENAFIDANLPAELLVFVRGVAGSSATR